MNHADLLQSMDHLRDVLEKMLVATPREHWRHQIAADANHVAWTIAHLAWADDLVLRAITGATGLPGVDGGEAATWDARFAWKTSPTDDLDGGPDPDTRVAVLRDRRTALRDWFAGLPAARFDDAPPADLEGWVPRLGVLPAAIAAHEAMHVGQLQMIRKSLRLDPVFM